MSLPWETPSSQSGFAKKKRGIDQARAKKRNYKTSGHPVWYPEYLKTPHWQTFKVKWRQSGRRRCCMICYNTKYDLHHWTYERIGQEKLDDVVPLCRAHHLKAHALEKSGVPLSEAHLKLMHS